MRRLHVATGAEAAAIEAAVGVLRRGGVVAYPTDTLYGLAVDPTSDVAVGRLFAVKARDRAQAIPLIAADLAQARAAGKLTPHDMQVATAFWPGPLALVVPARASLARGVAADDGTVAIRVPAHALARELAAQFGGCITATSANLSGHAPTAAADTVARSLADRIDLLLDAGDAPGGAPSTIVALGGASPRLVRAGAIAWDRVLKSLEGSP